MATRIAVVCRRQKVGEVVISWPKGILVETTANTKWQRLRHSFWSFDMMATRLAQALQRVGIPTARVDERGTSSHCPGL
jgi:transposase